MPRPLCLPPLPFHWYYFSRTATSGRQIVASRSELHLFRRLLASALARSGAHLHFAHVDENQVHLGLQSGEVSLIDALGSFCRRYARAVNRLRNEEGSLFRPHAHVLLVQHEKWFLPLGRYIHWIPRLQSLTAGPPARSWNTDAVYRHRHSIQDSVTGFTFRTLSRRSGGPRAQNQAYRAFFQQRPSQDEIDLFQSGSPEDGRMLGDPKFIAEISRELGIPPPRGSTRSSDITGNIRHATQTLVETFREVCDESLPAERALAWKRWVTLENICSKWRAPPLPMARALVASYVVTHQIAPLRHAERFFCCRPGTLSAGRRRRYETKFRELFNRPHEELFRTS